MTVFDSGHSGTEFRQSIFGSFTTMASDQVGQSGEGPIQIFRGFAPVGAFRKSGFICAHENEGRPNQQGTRRF
jgi:hypothetical protein